jgi:hypothetical protein
MARHLVSRVHPPFGIHYTIVGVVMVNLALGVAAVKHASACSGALCIPFGILWPHSTHSWPDVFEDQLLH